GDRHAEAVPPTVAGTRFRARACRQSLRCATVSRNKVGTVDMRLRLPFTTAISNVAAVVRRPPAILPLPVDLDGELSGIPPISDKLMDMVFKKCEDAKNDLERNL